MSGSVSGSGCNSPGRLGGGDFPPMPISARNRLSKVKNLTAKIAKNSLIYTRMIITSVALINAAAVWPFFSPISRTAPEVIREVIS